MSKENKTETNTSIFDKLTSAPSVILERVKGETLRESLSDSGQKFKLETEWNYNVRRNEKNRLVLTANCKVYFVPESLLTLDLEYSIAYGCKEEVSIEEIEEAAEKLLQPCGEVNSLIVAQLSDRMLGSPLILPPWIKFRNKK